jgi:hypothetical protein
MDEQVGSKKSFYPRNFRKKEMRKTLCGRKSGDLNSDIEGDLMEEVLLRVRLGPEPMGYVN